MNNAKITLVIGTYQEPELLIPTLKSFLEQTFEDFIIIVVDDNPPADAEIINRSRAIVDSFNDPRIQYIKNDFNIGVPCVYRKWIELVKTKYLYITGAGDKLMHNALELMVNFLESNPEVTMVYGRETSIDNKRNIREVLYSNRETGVFDSKDYLEFHMIGGKQNLGWSQASAVYRTEVFKIKKIPVTNNHYWDHYFHCTYLLHSKSIGYINDYMAIRHVDSGLNIWAQQNTFTHRLERRIQTSKFINEFEVLLIQKKYPINLYRLRNAIQIIKRIGYCHESEEFYLAARVAIGDLISVIGISILRILMYPLLKLFSLLRKQ